MWGRLWDYLYYVWINPFLKWIIHYATGKCELLRLTYSMSAGAARTLSIESSLKHSKSPTLQRLLEDSDLDVDEAVEQVLQVKSINTHQHPKFGPSLRTCLCQIGGYRQLIREVECLRKVPYSSDNPQHEELLLELWTTLRPDTPLKARISKQWSEIGFQGDDPMTDFRGMGLLGLHNLLYFVRVYPSCARQLLTHSYHPKSGYSFAIMGINLTDMAVQLLRGGHLKTHFYNVVEAKPQLEHFNQVYCYLMYDFDSFYRSEEPADIMQFNIIKKKFHHRMEHLLSKSSAKLLLSDLGISPD